MKFEHTKVFNIEGAIRGMRNPLDSWEKSDSKCLGYDNCMYCKVKHKSLDCIGKNDLDLCKRLIKAGTEHRKFLRQIFVSVDITAARYWWQEFDTYKVGITCNSCSTMHTITRRELTIDDFEINNSILEKEFLPILNILNSYIMGYNAEKIESIKKILPESFLQKRTVTMNYENILTMYNQRKHHKLSEWSLFIIKLVKELPYMSDFIMAIERKDESYYGCKFGELNNIDCSVSDCLGTQICPRTIKSSVDYKL